ncbi:MAG: hypothetical protein R2784_07640 [Saprospiraceae bacterium]
MGVAKVSTVKSQNQMQRFVQHLLNDIQAMEYMLNNDWFESDVVRIGAEQEMCLVDAKTYKPATINMEVLETTKDLPWLETELAKFNLETNLTPREFNGKCLTLLEQENYDYMQQIRQKLEPFGAKAVLTGILPTLRKYDLELHNLTPKPRYFALMESINKQLKEGSSYELRLEGIDELLIKHSSPCWKLVILPSRFTCGGTEGFSCLHNIAQALAAPVMAIATNSPIVFGKRLWHETRIALFQQALDTRVRWST